MRSILMNQILFDNRYVKIIAPQINSKVCFFLLIALDIRYYSAVCTRVTIFSKKN